MPSYTLTCHPATPCEAVRHFQAEVLLFGAELLLRDSLEGDIAALRVPAAGPHRDRRRALIGAAWHRP